MTTSSNSVSSNIISQLVKSMSKDQQEDFFNVFKSEAAKLDSNAKHTSLDLLARSADQCHNSDGKAECATKQSAAPLPQMVYEAEPFVVSQQAKLKIDHQVKGTTPNEKQIESLVLEKQAGAQLKDKLDKQVIVMKAQHQFIQNLQRANNQMKAKIKSLESNSADDSAAVFRDTSKTVVNESGNFQEMQMMPVGKIENLQRPNQTQFHTRDDKENQLGRHRSRSKGANKMQDQYYHSQGQSYHQTVYYDDDEYVITQRKSRQVQRPSEFQHQSSDQMRDYQNQVEKHHTRNRQRDPQADQHRHHEQQQRDIFQRVQKPDQTNNYSRGARDQRRQQQHEVNDEYGQNQQFEDDRAHHQKHYKQQQSSQNQFRSQGGRGRGNRPSQQISDETQPNHHQQNHHDDRRQEHQPAKNAPQSRGRGRRGQPADDHQSAQPNHERYHQGGRGAGGQATSNRNQNHTGNRKTNQRDERQPQATQQRSQGRGRRTQPDVETLSAHVDQQEEVQASNFQDFEKQFIDNYASLSNDGNDDEFLIKEPKYSQLHTFHESDNDSADDQDVLATDTATAQVNDDCLEESKCVQEEEEEPRIQELDCEQPDYSAMITDMREVHSSSSSQQCQPVNDSSEARQRLMRAFGVQQQPAEASIINNGDDQHELREQIARAVEEQDEQELDALIEQARQLGDQIEWQDELDQAESALYDMTCANNSSLQFLREQAEQTADKSQDQIELL